MRCPWHGWDYHPCTGKAPGYDDGVKVYEVEARNDGNICRFSNSERTFFTVSDIMVETMVNWGIDSVFGMAGHSNLGTADALKRQDKKGLKQA